jgi:uncharacterized protein YcbK (DUF882 family)
MRSNCWECNRNIGVAARATPYDAPWPVLAETLHLKLATAMMGSWFGATSPAPLPAVELALAVETHAAAPVEVTLHDATRRITTTVVIGRDGTTDPDTRKQLAHVFRCRTGREHEIAPQTLAMLADLSERYARPIEFVSGYRVKRGEPPRSPHRAARAIDFRIRGVRLSEVRDYLWRTYTGVGIGWYPSKQFIHMDARPEDMSWTFTSAGNRYHPFWADLARRERPPRRRPGV